ncbi:class II fructose-bisphosphate aldolase [Priestia aryabhattai]|uniref:class II fructose-bisphosphate aldolase n=1 Tax=Priestia megaterium TaxID=1404 RepID=UPI0039B9CB41
MTLVLKGLVSMKEMLLKGKEEKYAVAQININSFQWAEAILEAAQEDKFPSL